MPFCAGCGAEHAADARFCAGCGKPLTADVLATAAYSSQREPLPERVVSRLRTRLPDFVKDALHPSEVILASYSASLFDHRHAGQLRHDKFVLTDQRIIYFHTGLVHKGMGEMPYRTITGVQYSKGWIHGKVVIEAANASLTLDGIANDDAAFAERIIASALRGCKFEVSSKS